MTEQELKARIAELEAKLAASAEEDRVEDGVFQGSRTLTFYAKGKRPFTIGAGKYTTIKALMAKADAVMAKPKPFDSKS